MKATPTCPDEATLIRLRDGAVPKAQRQEMLEHIKGCASCRKVLRKLLAGHSGLQKAKSAASEPSADGPTRTLHPEGTPRHQAEVTDASDEDWEALLSPSGRAGSLGKLGHYEVLEMIGRGGMGVVLRAFDDKLQRMVAIKLLAPGLAGSATSRKRFVREARAAAAVRDNHVVNIYDVDENGPVPFLVMEFIAGVSLERRLKRGGAMELSDILQIGIQIAEGLAAAHKEGLVHRDIKPANILMENDGQRIKITDFGLARAVDDAALTQSGVVSGTPMFMAPEQAQGDAVDHRADLFSLGSVLYAMGTGHSPFRATSSVAVIRRVCDEPHKPLKQIRPDIPEWFSAIVDKLLTKDPDKRHSSAKAVADQMRRQLAALPQDHSPATPEQIAKTVQAVRPRRRRRWVLYVSAATAACLLAASAIWWFALRDHSNPVSKTTAAKKNLVTAPRAPAVLDFKRESIPKRLLELAGGGRAEKAMPELVAVFGDPTWLLPFGAKGSWTDQSPDGRLIAIPSNDTVAIFETDTGKHKHTLSGIRGRAYTVAFRPNGRQIAVGPIHGDVASDNVVRVYDVDTGTPAKVSYEGNKFPVYRVAYSPSDDGRYLVSVGGDSGKTGEIIVWESATGKKIQHITGKTAHVRNLAFVPKAKAKLKLDTFVTASDDEKINFWDARTGKLLRTVPFLSKGEAFGLAFRSDGKYLAAGNHSQTIVWPTEGNFEPGTENHWEEPGEWLAFRGESDVLLAAPHITDGGTAQLKELRMDVPPSLFPRQLTTGAYLDTAILSLNAKGDQLFSMTGDPQRCAFRPAHTFTAAGTTIQSGITIEELSVEALTMSPDGRNIFAGRPKNGALWDLETGKGPQGMLGDVEGVVFATFSPDGTRLATSTPKLKVKGLSGALTIWNTQTRLPVRAINDSRGGTFPSFSPDGAYVYAATAGNAPVHGSPGKWLVETGERQMSWAKDIKGITTMSASPDGLWVAAGGPDGVVLMLDAKTGTVVESFDVGGAIGVLRFADEGNCLACNYAAKGEGPNMHGVRLWEVPSWKTLPEPPKLRAVKGFAVHPTRRLVARSPGDGTVRLWESYADKEQMQVFGPGLFGKEAKRLAFTPDGKYLAVGGENGLINMLRLPSPGNMVYAAPIAKAAVPKSFKGWGTAIDPDEDCEIIQPTKTSTNLTIDVPSGHDLAHTRDIKKLNAPRVLQDIEGDFSLDVRLSSIFFVKGEAEAPIGMVAGGILIWENEQNFIRMENARVGDKWRIRLEGYVDAKQVLFKDEFESSANLTELKVIREGEYFTFSAQQLATGTGWQVLHQTNTIKLRSNLKVGVHVINASNSDVSVSFFGYSAAELKPLPPPGTFAPLALKSAAELAKTPGVADVYKRADIPSAMLARLGTGNGDAPKELVAVIGKVGDPQVVSLHLAQDGSRLLTNGIGDKKLQIFDLATGTITNSVAFPAKGSFSLSQDGALMLQVRSANERILDVIDMKTGVVQKTLGDVKPGKKLTFVRDIVFHPNNSMVALCENTGNIYIWDIATGAEKLHKSGLNLLNKMSFSPDGKFLAISGNLLKGGSVISVQKLDANKSDKPYRPLTGTGANVRNFAWHPGGQKLATTGTDGRIRVYDLPSMKEIAVMSTGATQVRGMAWHPGGDFLASSNHSAGTITLWDMRQSPPRLRQIIQLFPPDANSEKAAGSPNDIVFTPEGRHLIAGNSDGTISILRFADLGRS